ncbi:MAG: thioredoxin domain-containing protein [Flavobacteriaceae bacterium]
MTHRFTNELIHESSPYLLQHAHNPVNWYAWKPEVLKKARDENKLLVISIGYAACHWCHVMERECFEDEEVAQTMNKDFINIKIDREERPDIDHIYMDALQMMTGHGGWPLNIVALPEGRPFWGATYVKKDQWIRALEQLAQMYRENPQKLENYAKDLANGLQQVNLIENEPATGTMSMEELSELVKKWYRYFDTKKGGYNRAPKFMMPGNLDFLLHYAWSANDETILSYVDLTLTKMAYGGIFDHIGGGFSRYSVDTKWHVPHFEKMLYDNALLTSLYAKAYGMNKNELYAEVVRRTIDFLTAELMNSEGGFYSSLDADSTNKEGILEEGAFYVWTEEELKSILGENFELFKDYYNINSYGHWEHGNYVLIRDNPESEIAEKYKLSIDQFRKIIKESLGLLKEERNLRERPRLDDKILCSWNGLMLKGLTDAYRFLGDEKYLVLAKKNAEFLEKHFVQQTNELFHNHKDGKSSIPGYLEDYAALIDGFLGLYEVTFDEKWLSLARKLTDYCFDNLYDDSSQLFYFTSKNNEYIIRRTLETGDNVIPASNSIMCKNLLKLSKFYMDANYGDKMEMMIRRMQEKIIEHPESHANWLHIILYDNLPFYEVAIVGSEYMESSAFLQENYLPNSIFVGAEKNGGIELLENRYKDGSTLIYICEGGSCRLPLESPSDALEQLRNNE